MKNLKGIFSFYSNLDLLHKLLIAFGFAILCMSVVGYQGYRTARAKVESVNIIFENNLKPVRWINLVRIDLNANRTNLYHAILNIGRNRADLEAYLSDIAIRAKRIDDNLAAAKVKLAELSDDYLLQEVSLLQEELSEYRAGRALVIQFIRRGDLPGALQRAEAQRDFAFQVFTHAANIADHIETRAGTRQKRVQAEARSAVVWILTLVLLALIFSSALVTGVSLDIRNLLRRLTKKMRAVSSGDLQVSDFSGWRPNDIGALYECFNAMNGILKKLAGFIDSTALATQEIGATAHELDKTAEQSTLGAQQMSSKLEQLSQGTQESSRSLTQSFEEMHAVNAIIQKITRSMENSAAVSDATRSSVVDGRQHVLQAVDSMGAIKSAATEVSSAVSELSQLSSEIETIVTLISTIADQTSLLSLNASIEAARAGEEGRGFAVVANEVGKLASSSTQAAASIANLIRKVQSRIRDADVAMANGLKEVQDGAMVIEKVGDTFEGVLVKAEQASKEARTVAGELVTVSTNTASVVSSIESVSAIGKESADGIESISLISQDQYVSTEEIFANSKSLTNVVEKLSAQLSGFRVQAGAAQASPLASRRK